MAMVFEFTGVGKRYGRQVALDDVSFRGERGRVVALLGENGAGKTTALRILLGLERPTAGITSVLDIDSQRHGEEIRRRVGYVPDRPALYDWMTVGEVGWFTAGFYPTGFQGRYRELVAQYGLPEDRKLKALSKGMLAKVSLALALAPEPELLVLDEPTSGLDPLVRREFLESMVDVAAAGRTVLLSSHQIAEVERVADSVIVLRQGKLVLDAELRDLKDGVRLVTITTAAGDDVEPKLPEGITVLAAQRRGVQWQMLVRARRPQLLDELEDRPDVRDVRIDTLSLEEMFVTLMRPKARLPVPTEPADTDSEGVLTEEVLP
jgi:ABC-2 type transport system ATP-binding protein